ncbi:unnamed protein product, partial [Mesorhabditis belari]|uniref:Hexosyltransferase n=1 Tax=Mesorhabditis belari TaxID=2138241 RepID=A0AAF3J3N7_9BILA
MKLANVCWEIVSSDEEDQASTSTISPSHRAPPKKPPNPSNEKESLQKYFYQPFAWKLLPKNNTCGPNVTTLIVVHSANQYSLYRKAIRETYGKKKYQEMFNYRLFFAEGKSENLTKEANLREEAAQYEDIIQADFLDSYRNLTIKYLMWMRYVRDFCPDTELVLKIDDDILVDIFWLFEEIRIKKISKERCFTCRLNQGNVIRDTTHKWYVSKDAMPEDAWNVYSSGIAVIQGKLSFSNEHSSILLPLYGYCTSLLTYKM